MKRTLFTSLLLASLVLVLSVPTTSSAFFGGKFKTVKAQNGEVHIPVANVNDGKAHYFSLKSDGKAIHFFVVKSRDGIIRAAFDACDVCFPAQKGYSQKGDYMICNNCGRAFHSTQVNEVEGGCNPAPLKRNQTGDTLVIQKDDILTGARFF